jgi:DNA replication and repair protein RecF
MLYLQKLTLFQFKNYGRAQLDFQGDVQCFVGKNGSGKTNVLDAIHYLSFTKSAWNSSDTQSILSGCEEFRVAGEFLKEGRVHEVTCSFTAGEKKIMQEDQQPVPRFSGHLGKYPAVLVAPHDIQLIWGGSEGRRRFFDNLIAQVSREYLDHLMNYTHHLRQRNGLLKLFAERGSADLDMLEAYDEKLIPSANFIQQKRCDVRAGFCSMLEHHYTFLVDGLGEHVGIEYVPDPAGGDFATELKKNRSRDLLLQRTSCGVHRDDFRFTLNEADLHHRGSQGQQKSFLIALKLAEFQFLAEHKKIKPLLLLDDIFDKLDDERIHRLMVLVANGTFGQLFITDARNLRSREILGDAGIKASVFEVVDGTVSR